MAVIRAVALKLAGPVSPRRKAWIAWMAWKAYGKHMESIWKAWHSYTFIESS